MCRLLLPITAMAQFAVSDLSGHVIAIWMGLHIPHGVSKVLG